MYILHTLDTNVSILTLVVPSHSRIQDHFHRSGINSATNCGFATAKAEMSFVESKSIHLANNSRNTANSKSFLAKYLYLIEFDILLLTKSSKFIFKVVNHFSLGFLSIYKYI
jgi:hypothetical protein